MILVENGVLLFGVDVFKRLIDVRSRWFLICRRSYYSYCHNLGALDGSSSNLQSALPRLEHKEDDFCEQNGRLWRRVSNHDHG